MAQYSMHRFHNISAHSPPWANKLDRWTVLLIERLTDELIWLIVLLLGSLTLSLTYSQRREER